jgi:hypothetical protein
MNAEAVLSKIDAVRADLNAKLDEIAASVGGEGNEGDEAMAEGEAPEQEAAENEIPMKKGAAPVAVAEEKKIVYGKKKPGDMLRTLGIG